MYIDSKHMYIYISYWSKGSNCRACMERKPYSLSREQTENEVSALALIAEWNNLFFSEACI